MTGMTDMNSDFFEGLDQLVAESKIIIDRPKGSRHPRYPEYIYPLDYGYLENTTAMDGDGIDVWVGTDGNAVDAVACTVDLLKRDCEIKIFVGCTEAEKQQVMAFYGNGSQKKMLIRRGTH